MKINQVEELVGITKKNIRFYEAQGLLSPDRDPANGYREYTLRDVEQLNRIRLFRKLDIPCEEIRQMMNGERSLSECVRTQEEKLEKRGSDLKRMQEICEELAGSGAEFDTLDAAVWLDRMKTLEKGGVQFMDTRRSDVKQRQRGAVLSALAGMLFFAAMIGVIIWANSQDPIPNVVLAFILLILAGMIAGIGLALYQRMKELKGGELDEAGKY